VEKVAAVKDIGKAAMYDIEVDKTHTYLVNGMVSHNTVNLPNQASTEEVRKVFLLANELELKGITIFRDGSLEGLQVLYAGCPTCDDVRFPESP
jgi:ribonucleoside-diphosphate reductase alpha chain